MADTLNEHLLYYEGRAATDPDFGSRHDCAVIAEKIHSLLARQGGTVVDSSRSLGLSLAAIEERLTAVEERAGKKGLIARMFGAE